MDGKADPERFSRGFSGVAFAPMGTRQAPADFDAWREAGFKAWDGQADKSHELA